MVGSSWTPAVRRLHVGDGASRAARRRPLDHHTPRARRHQGRQVHTILPGRRPAPDRVAAAYEHPEQMAKQIAVAIAHQNDGFQIASCTVLSLGTLALSAFALARARAHPPPSLTLARSPPVSAALFFRRSTARKSRATAPPRRAPAPQSRAQHRHVEPQPRHRALPMRPQLQRRAHADPSERVRPEVLTERCSVCLDLDVAAGEAGRARAATPPWRSSVSASRTKRDEGSPLLGADDLGRAAPSRRRRLRELEVSRPDDASEWVLAAGSIGLSRAMHSSKRSGFCPS